MTATSSICSSTQMTDIVLGDWVPDAFVLLLAGSQLHTVHSGIVEQRAQGTQGTQGGEQ